MELEKFDELLCSCVGKDATKQYNYLKKFDNRIFPNDSDWHLFKNGHYKKLNEGVYLTIRVVYSGIYTMLNTWNSKTNDWDVLVADGSYTIMYRDLTEEDFK